MNHAVHGVVLLLLLTGCSGEEWPEHRPSIAAVAIGEAAAIEYRTRGLVARTQQPHSAVGDYLSYSSTVDHARSANPRLKFDGANIPMVRYGDSFYYNPVTISQFALGEYGRGLSSGEYTSFFKAADKLLEIQDTDGAFRYRIPKRHYTMPAAYRDGWISGMAQGQVLSVMARAWNLSQNKAYLHAGNLALEFLTTPIDRGGPMTTLADLDPSLSNYIFFEEYLSKPNVYTLNGYVFTLLGLYDWCHAADSDAACRHFSQGVQTLEKLLPYYDLGNFSTYDLSYITHRRPDFIEPLHAHVDVGYHRLHIQLLFALHSAAESPVFKATAERWLSYVEPSRILEVTASAK
jgi:D-glucuronyl C5-epimerase C-terminus.